MNALRLGTRGSQLALVQAQAVAAAIEAAGGPASAIVVIKTSGDRLAEAPLGQVGGKRLFVKEIEDALLRNDIDLAVHSSKDMPVILPDGLVIGAVLPREDPYDALILRAPLAARSLQDAIPVLGSSPSVGTGSVRRIAQLTRLMPGARFEPIRGNLDTRLGKLDRGEYDALVLAAAGMKRLGVQARISVTLPVNACVPAPGQGAIAVEVRANDAGVRQWIGSINDAASSSALQAERALVAALGGGCQTPIGALALPEGPAGLELHAVVVSLDGRRALRHRDRGARADAPMLGRRVAEQLIKDGAADILCGLQGSRAAVEGIQP
jgi:hydroxymethylbilane synthase